MDTMMAPELLHRLAARFAALADPSRLRLLMQLRDGRCRVADLVAATGLAQPSVSKHLAVLRQAGLVEAERVGNEAHYGVRDATLFQLCDLVCGAVRAQVAAEAEAIGATTVTATAAASATSTAHRRRG